MTEQATKTLTAMAAEVDAYCEDKGWRENPVSFAEAMALLHSEVSEALDAWRAWGLANPADSHLCRNGDCDPVCVWAKPQGVGSEFADIFIRWLDDCAYFCIDPDDALGLVIGGHGIHDSFAENMNLLHVLIARVSEAHAVADPVWPACLADVYATLWHLCEVYGIDLFAEYERKMTYNRSRPYKHGGRTI